MKKLNYGLDHADGFYDTEIDWRYLEDELAFKLGHKKDGYGNWQYGNYPPDFEFYEVGGKLLALAKSNHPAMYGDEAWSSNSLYILREETEKEIEVREKRQAKERDKAEAKALKEKNKAKIDKERAIKSAQTVLEKAGYKVIK